MTMFSEPERLELFSELANSSSIINPLTSPGVIIGQKQDQITLTNQEIQTLILNQITSELRPSGGSSSGGGGITPPPSSHERYYLIEKLEQHLEHIEQGRRSVKDLNSWAQSLINELHSQVALASTVAKILDEAQEQAKEQYIDNTLGAINGLSTVLYYRIISELDVLYGQMGHIDLDPPTNAEQWWNTIDQQIKELDQPMGDLIISYEEVSEREAIGRTTFSQCDPIIRRYALSDMLFQWSSDSVLNGIFEQTTSEGVKDIVSRSKSKFKRQAGEQFTTEETNPSIPPIYLD